MAHGAMIIAVAGPCSCDSSAIVAALAAARARCLQRDQLVARLNSARMFNPGLHVLFAVVCGDAEPSAAQLACVRGHASEVMSATRCKTVIDSGSGNAIGMAELYHDVFEHWTIELIPRQNLISPLPERLQS